MESFLRQYSIDEKTIAVGVSGGSDSLALVLMAQEELTVFGYKIIALTVNHKLRPKADAEADYVAEIMHQKHIEHHILTWEDPKPSGGIEENARKARYDLMINWCKKNNIHILMTAHHMMDQAETFLMRLERGSGLEGLCSMRPAVWRNGVQILRPLLYTDPQKLKDYLRHKNIRWIDDESNHEEKYLRNKLRCFLPTLAEKTGITCAKIITAVKNLQSAEDFIQSQIDLILSTQVQNPLPAVFYFKHADFLSWHSELQFRIISHFCQREYIPRAESVLHLISSLKKLPFKSATLGKKEILLHNRDLWILPENQQKIPNSRKIWKTFIEENPQYKNKKVPHQFKILLLKEWENKK